jgi:hypothetical protein
MTDRPCDENREMIRAFSDIMGWDLDEAASIVRVRGTAKTIADTFVLGRKRLSPGEERAEMTRIWDLDTWHGAEAEEKPRVRARDVDGSRDRASIDIFTGDLS